MPFLPDAVVSDTVLPGAVVSVVAELPEDVNGWKLRKWKEVDVWEKTINGERVISRIGPRKPQPRAESAANARVANMSRLLRDVAIEACALSNQAADQCE